MACYVSVNRCTLHQTMGLSRIKLRSLPGKTAIQTIHATKAQNDICLWNDDVIGGKRWNHVTYQREYRFLLDFGSISRDGIMLEQATPADSRFCCTKSNLHLLAPAGFALLDPSQFHRGRKHRFSPPSDRVRKLRQGNQRTKRERHGELGS
jgi:hypothetical protein